MASTAAKSRKRKNEEPIAATPSKRTTITPSTNRRAEVPKFDSPSLVRKLFTPSQTRIIGPTPQKDGIPLGLFDVLSEEGTPHRNTTTVTPSKNKLAATPSKSSQLAIDSASIHKHAQTPSSSTNKHMLGSFLTPSKRVNIDSQKTPQQSVSKLNFFATPSFLRRGGVAPKLLPSIAEDGTAEPPSPEMVHGPRKPLVRGLSSMLRSLRKMEEEAADEDLDLLREMEGDSAQAAPKSKPAPVVQVEDSQLVPQLLGGFDDEAMFDSEPEEVLDRGQPLKIYKKKGQKRTTRKVKMKPPRVKPSTASTPAQPYASDDDDAISQEVPPDLDDTIAPLETVIPETQQQGFDDARNFDTDSSGSEYTASEGGTRYRRPDQGGKRNQKARNRTDGNVEKKKGIRKAGALASQNFKRLKLRNSGAKGGPGHGSRFRRKK